VNDKDLLNTVFDTHKIDTVFDFTGKKAVGESTHLPILYYKNNISGESQKDYYKNKENRNNYL